jgi:hypothetical protein
MGLKSSTLRSSRYNENMNENRSSLRRSRLNFEENRNNLRYNRNNLRYNRNNSRYNRNNLDDDQEENIINEYNQIINRHELLDTIKKSKKQQTFFLKDYHIIKLENSDLLLQDKCPICLEKLSIGDDIYLIPCCHYFHKNCLKDWIMIENDCPSCRMKMGNNSAEEIDMCLFTREDKINKAKHRYLSKLSLDELKELSEKNNIQIKDYSKNKILKELLKLDNLYHDDELVKSSSSNLSDEGLSKESYSEGLSKESNSEGLTEESYSEGLSKESNSEGLTEESYSEGLSEESYSEGLSEESSSNKSTSSSLDSDTSIKIRYVRAG